MNEDTPIREDYITNDTTRSNRGIITAQKKNEITTFQYFRDKNISLRQKQKESQRMTLLLLPIWKKRWGQADDYNDGLSLSDAAILLLFYYY